MDFLIALDAFFASYVNDVLFWLLFFFLSWNAYILLFNKGVPNIRTAPAVRRLIIEALKDDYKTKQKDGYRVIDLGAGNGKLSRHIARALPEAQVIGIEIAAKSYHWANITARLCGLQNLTYKRADFFSDKCSLAEADAVVFFLSAYEMGRMGEKLGKDLEQGTLVISNRFFLPDDWTVKKSVTALHMNFIEKCLHPFQKTIHLYDKP